MSSGRAFAVMMLLAILSSAGIGCGAEDDSCVVNRDCNNGLLCVDGQCQHVGLADGGTDAQSARDAGDSGDAGDAGDAGTSTDAARDATAVDSASGLCGNGTQEGTEACDDGNLLSGDGCSGSCVTETAGTFASPATFAPPASGPLRHCRAYRQAGAGLSGIYTIDPDTAGPRDPYQVYCDMVLDGGGFTLVTYNHNGDAEPSGCVPVIGSVDSMGCGTISGSQDFVVPAYGIPFTNLIFAAVDDTFQVAAYSLLLFRTPTTIPNSQLFSRNADVSGGRLAGVSAPEIRCAPASGSSPLRAMRNVHPLGAGLYSQAAVVTVFPQMTTGPAFHMGITDNHNGVSGSAFGIDDFQDGEGCADAWEPKAVRGFSSWILVR